MITTSDLRALRASLTKVEAFRHCTTRTWAKLVVLLLALAGVLSLVVILPWWWSFVLIPLAAVPAVAAAMIGHEAAHGSFAASRTHNEVVLHLVFPLFGGLSAQYWKHKHNHLHHGHPNVLQRDPDMNVWPMALSNVEYARSSRVRRWLQRTLQGYLFWPLTLFLAFTMRVDSMRHVVARARRGLDRALLLDVACLAGHYALWIAIPIAWVGVWPTLLVYAGLWATSGLLLALIFAPAHMGLPLHEEDQGGGWERQLEATRNLSLPRWISWWFIGLDFQVEHHLFPRIPHQNLRRASPIVAAWCSDVGLPYNRMHYVSSVRQVTSHLRLAWQAVPEVSVLHARADEIAADRRPLEPGS